jgi:hypothetical protein
MRDSINNCGVLKAPPHTMTSRRAKTRRNSPGALLGTACARYKCRPFKYSTPQASPFSSNNTRVASASSSM